MAKSASNPFDHAFEMLGDAPDIATDCVNSEALELLTQALTSRATDRGRMVLLRSPRAGFGKTHLLKRLHQRVAHTHEFIPLEPSKGKNLNAAECLDAVLRRFSRILPAGGGLTVLDLLARRILATGLEPLVRSGEVPSQDRDSALQALQERPVETFDFHNEEAVTARWAQANFSLLGPRLTAELAERTEAGFRPVAWWVELLFRYSSAELDQTTRNSSLFETVFGNGSVETDMHEKLVTLMNLTGLVTSPVLVLDEVEGFSSNPEAALQVASFLNALHQSCNELALIISVNGDVWETAFLPRLPCGLKDRLSDIVIDLRPMTKDQAAKLIGDRAGEHADRILDAMDLDTGVIYARGLIREASNTWEELGLVKSDDEQSQSTPASLQLTPATSTGPISLAAEPEPTPTYDAPSQQPESTAPYTVPAVSAAVTAAASTSDAIAAAAAAAEMEEDNIAPAFEPVTQRVSEAMTPVADSPFQQVTEPVASQAVPTYHEEVNTPEPVEPMASPFAVVDQQDFASTSDPATTDVSDQQGSEGLPYFGDVADEVEGDQSVPSQPFAQPFAQTAEQPFAQPQEQTPEPAYSTQPIQAEASQYAEARPFADEIQQSAEAQPQQPSPFSFVEESEPVAASPFEQAVSEPVYEEPPFTPAEPVHSIPQPRESSVAKDSPFSIDTEANPVSPFQPTQPAVTQPVAPVQAEQQPATQPFQTQQAEPVQQPVQGSPFDTTSASEPVAHAVTSDDQEKVEDLLRQFRDRYGRNE